MADLNEAVENRESIKYIKQRYLSGQISREQAKLEASPIIYRINKRQAEISKKWNKKHYPIDFISLMR